MSGEALNRLDSFSLPIIGTKEDRLADLTAALNARLLNADSATAVLESWCKAPVRARKITCPARPLTPEQKQRLQVEDESEILYRRVELLCADIVLSHADNWYRKDRLTEDMLEVLSATDTPFGTVVRPLSPIRNSFSVNCLQPPFLVEHRALLTVAAGPLCEVRECYTEALAHIGGNGAG